MKEFDFIGKDIPRVDAIDKATGNAKFTVDLFFPNMLHAKLLRSPLPHAKILNVDTRRAERLPGLKAVITGKDTPYVFGVSHFDQTPLQTEKVRHVGDAVAAVAAIDVDIVEEALRLIKVDYEPLPAVFDAVEAMKPGSDHPRGNFVMLDNDDALVEAARREGLAARQVDYTDDDALREVGIGSQIEGVFCLFTEDSENVFLAISARELDPQLRIVAVCQAPEAAPKLLAAGADKVVDPYEISGARVHELIERPEVVELLEQTVFGMQDLNVAEITIPPHSWLHGVHLSGLRKFMNQNVILLGVVDLERGKDLIFSTTDGKMFDSSVTRGTPANFGLGQVIPGWTEGLQLMVEGEKRRFWIPEKLAYKGRPGKPAGMLVFDVELLAIQN